MDECIRIIQILINQDIYRSYLDFIYASDVVSHNGLLLKDLRVLIGQFSSGMEAYQKIEIKWSISQSDLLRAALEITTMLCNW